MKDKIITSEPPWYKRAFPWLPFGEEPRFDPNAWRSDLRRIERFYQARGFYQAEVVDEQVLTPERDAGRARGPAARGRPRERARSARGAPRSWSTSSCADWRGCLRTLQRLLRKNLALKEGQIFEEAKWSELKYAARRAAARARSRRGGGGGRGAGGRGHPAGRAQRGGRSPDAATRFGRIFVSTGPDPVVSPARIIDQARSVIREGDVYSESALAEAQSKVMLMGVFGGVKVNRGLANRQAGTVPVVVEVREAPFHSVRLGVGVGFDAFRSEARLLGEYTDRDFLGGLRRLNVTGRVGYAWAANILDALFSNNFTNDTSGFIFNVQAQLEQPRILFQDVSGRLETYVERGVEPAFTYLGGGVKLGFAWRPSADFSFRPSIAFEAYQIDGATGLTGIGTIGEPTGSNVALGCPSGADSCFVPLNYLEQVIEYDKRDNPIAPTSGYYLSLSLQEGGGPLSDYAFVRIMPEGRVYESSWTGALDDRRPPPPGHPHHLRDLRATPPPSRPSSPASSPVAPPRCAGFSSGRLSPMQLVLETPPGQPLPPPELVPPSGKEGQKQLDRRRLVPLGGNGLVDASIEARMTGWGSPTSSLATFLDAGLVTSQPFALTGERLLREQSRFLRARRRRVPRSQPARRGGRRDPLPDGGRSHPPGLRLPAPVRRSPGGRSPGTSSTSTTPAASASAPTAPRRAPLPAAAMAGRPKAAACSISPSARPSEPWPGASRAGCDALRLPVAGRRRFLGVLAAHRARCCCWGSPGGCSGCRARAERPGCARSPWTHCARSWRAGWRSRRSSWSCREPWCSGASSCAPPRESWWRGSPSCAAASRSPGSWTGPSTCATWR